MVLLIFPFFILQIPFSVRFSREEKILSNYTTSHWIHQGIWPGWKGREGWEVNEYSMMGTSSSYLSQGNPALPSARHQKTQKSQNPTKKKREKTFKCPNCGKKNGITNQDKTQSCKNQLPQTWGTDTGAGNVAVKLLKIFILPVPKSQGLVV